MRVLGIVLLALVLAGCTVTYTEYPYGRGYAYPGYYYRSGPDYHPYYRGYYWHGAP